MPNVGVRTARNLQCLWMGVYQATNIQRNIQRKVCWMGLDQVGAWNADGGLEQAFGSVDAELEPGQTGINPQELHIRATVKLIHSSNIMDRRMPSQLNLHLRHDDSRTYSATAPSFPLLVPIDCGLPTISIHVPNFLMKPSPDPPMP